ncbi:hypothetical protein C7476_102331 [Phyllobacterium bourgognense]|uniref:Uncharacterized protein n=1 Tax=Phyllobacterium bourgognense TaxID=314236 RepID=A0A368Z1R5_9HYPH|nr:hypothetical protein C7476_102331 [Phyllobacterium bourgognense]
MSYRTVFQNPCPDQDFASALFLQQTGGEMPESVDSLCKDNAGIVSRGNPKRRIQHVFSQPRSSPVNTYMPYAN